MVLQNKLHIKDPAELARCEEKISKDKAKQLYDSGLINSVPIGKFDGLAVIHKYLFADIYEFAGEIRDFNLAKGQFSFAPVMYLVPALEYIDNMPQENFNQIIEKYVEMNVAHPFREGNGRSMRIWLDLMLRQKIAKVIDWSKITKDDYLLAMERSPIKDIELKYIIKGALTSDINNREIYMKGIDQSYYYEGYVTYSINEFD